MGFLLLSTFSKVPFIKLINGLVKKEDMDMIQNSLRIFFNSLLYFQYNPVLTLKTLEKDILYHIYRNEIKIVYLENLSSLMKNQNDEHELYRLINNLKKCAKNTKTIIITNFSPLKNKQNKKLYEVLELESDIYLHLSKKRVLENNCFIEYRLDAINESLCLHQDSLLYFDVYENKFLEKNRVNLLSKKEINSFDILERISYLLNNLFSCYNILKTCKDYKQKEIIADLYYRLRIEFKQIPDIKVLLESYYSLDKLKTEIDSWLETLLYLSSDPKLLNISENEIKELENSLKHYQVVINDEIADRLVDEEIEESLSS